MRITSGGNLLIGNTDQNFKLSVVESTNAVVTAIRALNASYTSSTLLLDAGPAASTSYNHIQARSNFNSSAVANFLVQGNGNVSNTNGSYGTLSDIKLKENIVDAAPKLEKLMQVRVVNYNLKSELGYEAHKQLGVVAQELEQVFPSLVSESPDVDAEGKTLGTTTKNVKMSVFVPMLIKAIQEQQQIINDLKARIETLENK